MSESVGAIATIFEKQKYSSYEMIKSYRTYNPTSSIVVIQDGKVDGIEEICKEFNCSLYESDEQIGYPASIDITIPLKQLYRLFKASFSIEENYFINLEPDCLVYGSITIPYIDYDCIVNQDSTSQWIFYLNGNDKARSSVIPEVISFYQKEGVYIEPIHDKIMGGGGDIYNMNFVRTVYNKWDKFIERSYFLKNIYDKYTENFVWYQDYILSLQLPFYGQSKYGGTSEIYMKNLIDLDLKGKIMHPYKRFYN